VTKYKKINQSTFYKCFIFSLVQCVIFKINTELQWKTARKNSVYAAHQMVPIPITLSDLEDFLGSYVSCLKPI